MRQGSLTRAAQSLNMSQSTVSRRIHRLERDLGCQLLDRQLLSIGPTRQGLALIRFAETTLAAQESLFKELREPPAPSPSLNIASSTTPAEVLVPRLVARFRKKHPSVKTHVHVMDSVTVETCIAERHCDVGFMGKHPRPGGLSRIPVAQDELRLAVPEGHPLAVRKEAGIDDILDLSFVERREGSGTRALVEEALRACGLPAGCLKVASEVSSSHHLLGAIREGQGVGFISKQFLPAKGVLGLRVTGLALVRSLYILYRADDQRPEVQGFVRLVVAAAGLEPGTLSAL